jgi:hypothetical protein
VSPIGINPGANGVLNALESLDKPKSLSKGDKKEEKTQTTTT